MTQPLNPENFQWPIDYKKEKKRRWKLIKKAEKDRATRIAMMRYYKTRPVEWINDFCVTFDPRIEEGSRIVPFVLFPRQVEFINFLYSCLQDKESGLVEKSRDVGLSWLCCAFSDWLWIFHPGSAIGFGSRVSEDVDRPGDPKALFTKMRQILKNLPTWMMPEGFNWSVHSTHMKLINPKNGSTITGGSGDNIGRGGRTTIFFKDESAHYENPESIEAALGDNTNVQIDISSVNGTNNPFYKRRMAGEVWHPEKTPTKGMTRVFIFDWRDHPGKTQEWYDERRAKAEREGAMHILAQEVDRDYSGAIQGVIIPQAWVKAAIDAHIKLGIETEMETGTIRAMQDVADEGADKNALVIGKGVICRFADHWAGEAGAAARHAVPLCVERSVKDLYYDCIGVGVGFKTEINTMMKEINWPAHMKLHPWDAGAGPLNPDQPCIPGDQRAPKNKDEYANMKAQAWFSARARFYKTYQAVVHGKKYPAEELVSIDSTIPRLHELCLELSQAVRKSNGVGPTVVDKKPKGATSPNLADAFIGWLFPCKKSSLFDL